MHSVKMREMVSMLQRDHPGVAVVYAANVRLRCIVASAGETVPARGCTWSVVLHHNDQHTLVQVDLNRLRKQLITCADALWPGDPAVQPTITHVKVCIGGPGVDPYVRRLPLLGLAERYEAPRARDALFVSMDDTAGGVSYFDDFVTKRSADNEPRYLEVNLTLMAEETELTRAHYCAIASGGWAAGQ